MCVNHAFRGNPSQPKSTEIAPGKGRKAGRKEGSKEGSKERRKEETMDETCGLEGSEMERENVSEIDFRWSVGLFCLSGR